MNGLTRFLLSGLAILLTGYLLPGVRIENYFYALLVAIILSFLNVIVKPILIFFTIPITFITFGLFLLVINALIILLASYFTPGFYVDGFWWALAFSLILSLFNSLFADLSRKER